MPTADYLIRLAEEFERKAKAIRETAAIMAHESIARAHRSMPAKLAAAGRLRTGKRPPSRERGAKGEYFERVGELLRHPLAEGELKTRLKDHGLDGRGLSGLYTNRLIVLAGGRVKLTKAGRRRLKAKAATPRRASAKGAPEAKGAGNNASTVIAEILRAEGAPLAAAEVIARAKANGHKLVPQAFGAALRHGVIAANGNRGAKGRTFSLPA